jgi:hypothetical protein
MKLAALLILLAAPLMAQNAPVEEKIDTPLEYWFGGLALTALVMTWLWLWLRIRGKVKETQPEASQ